MRAAAADAGRQRLDESTRVGTDEAGVLAGKLQGVVSSRVAASDTLHSGDEGIVADGGGGMMGKIAVEDSEMTEVREDVVAGALSKRAGAVGKDL